MITQLEALDTKLFYLINKGWRADFLDVFVPYVTDIGSGVFVCVLALLFLVSRAEKAKRAGLLLLGGLGASYCATHLLKNLVARPRPFLVLENASALVRAGEYSFPSGHAVVSFMAAAILSRSYKKFSAVFYPLAFFVCLTRIYLGVHYPSDCVAGALLGLLIGNILTKVTSTVHR